MLLRGQLLNLAYPKALLFLSLSFPLLKLLSLIKWRNSLGSRREYLPGLAGAMLSQGNEGVGLLQLLRYKSGAAGALRYPLRYSEVYLRYEINMH